MSNSVTLVVWKTFVGTREDSVYLLFYGIPCSVATDRCDSVPDRQPSGVPRPAGSPFSWPVVIQRRFQSSKSQNQLLPGGCSMPNYGANTLAFRTLAPTTVS